MGWVRLGKLLFCIRIYGLVPLIYAFENKFSAPAIGSPADADFVHLFKGVNKIGKAVVHLPKEEKVELKGGTCGKMGVCGNGWLDHKGVRGSCQAGSG